MSAITDVLQKHEEAVVRVLKQEDVRQLHENLYEKMVISDETKDKFISLDHGNLKNELMVRYLLQHVYDAMKHNKWVFYSFLDILSDIDGDVAGKLRRELREYELAGIVGKSYSSASVGRRSRATIGDYRLSEEDVPILTEILIECSHKWEELGIALGLLSYQIEDCGLGSSIPIRLWKVIKQWIDITEHPTIGKLKSALSNALVAMKNKACELENQFIGKIKPFSHKTEYPECDFRPVYRSGATKIISGKSALLGFQVSSTKPVKYQWRKNGQPLSDNEVYLGTNSAILFINCVADQIEGQYDSQVYLEDFIVMTSGNINLTMSSSEITKQFLKIYSKMSEIPKDSWPPVSNSEFINLALISRDEHTNDEYTYAVQGDMDDVIESKKTIEYGEVFGKYESGALLLIEGRPGSGKTTLMHKVTRDWAVKRSTLLGAEIVVLVPLRFFVDSFEEDVTLTSIFGKFIECDRERGNIIKIVKERNGEGVCFIIDGLDEYEFSNNSNTTIFKLIHKQMLHLAMVIVSSRPVGTAAVRNTETVSKHIEVLGFKNEQIFEYIESYYKNRKEMAHKLQSYLNLHINVLRLCYLPVHTAMICFLYDKLRNNIPQNEAQIYESFTILTLLRKLNRGDLKVARISSLYSLPGDIKEYFSEICCLAFDMVIHSKQVVFQSKTKFALSSPGSDKSSLGLVTIDSSAEVFGMEDLYAFLHLTFQEYLAACYLARLRDEKEVLLKTSERHKMAQNCSHNNVQFVDQDASDTEDCSNLQMVWKFYCGIVQFPDNSLVLKYLMNDTDTDIFYKFQCAFESQQQVVCDSVLEIKKKDALFFENHNVLPTDFLAIGYVISTTRHTVSTLIFTNCILNRDGVSLFLEKMSRVHLGNIKYLGYHTTKNSDPQLEILNVLLRELTNLEVLDLEDAKLGVHGAKYLTESVELPNLTTLKINLPLLRVFSDQPELESAAVEVARVEDTDIEDAKVLRLLSCSSTKLEQIQYFYHQSSSYLETTKSIVQLLAAFSSVFLINSSSGLFSCFNTKLQIVSQSIVQRLDKCSKLLLVNCDITDKELNILVKSITTCRELNTLHLDFNKITSIGAVLLSDSLKECTELEVLSVHCNQIDDYGAMKMVNSLVQLSNPKLLDLQCNPVTEDGIQTLAKSQMGFQLYVTTSNHEVANKSNLKLVQRSIDFICMHENGIQALCSALQCCANLQVLDVRRKNITSDCSKSLIEALKYCTNLQVLNLGANCIGPSCVMDLANRIKCCSYLQKLYLFRTGMDSDGAAALAEGLKFCTDLKVLDLSTNTIGSNGAVALAEGLKYCTKLQTLHMNTNRIGSYGIVALVEGLKCCRNLQALYLGSNNIGTPGSVALAKGLQCFTEVQILYLSASSICSDGAGALADGLKTSTNLQRLHLNANNITSDGAIALAQGLKYCTRLQSVYLSSNRIGLDGATALVEGLKNCSNLKQLYLRDNIIDIQALASEHDQFNKVSW